MANFSRLFFITIAALMVIPAGCNKNSAITGEDTDESGSVTEGSPIDLPVPIAKGIDGVDPTPVRIVEGSSNTNGRLQAERQGSGDIIGTLYFQLTNTSSDRLVALVSSEKIVDSTITSGGAGSFVLTSDYVGTPLALVVAGENTSVDNSGPWSPPIMVTLYLDEDDLVAGDYFIVVSITNTGREMTGPLTGADIGLNYAVPSSGDSVTFTALDPSDAPFIGTVPLTGGDIEVISEEPPNLLKDIAYDSTGVLTGIDETTGAIYRLSAEGEITYAESSSLNPGPELRYFSISPDNRWMAVNRLISSGSSAYGLTVIDLNNPSSEIVPVIVGQSTDLDHLFFDWRDEDRLLAFSIGSSWDRLYSLYLGNVLSGGSGPVVPETIFEMTSSAFGVKPLFNEARNELVYSCQDVPLRIFHLCLYNFDSAENSVIVSDSVFDTVIFNLSTDGSYVVFQADLDPDIAEIDPIGIYVFGTGELHFPVKGAHPISSPADPNIVIYGTCDTTGDELCDENDVGGLQISVLNLANVGIDF